MPGSYDSMMERVCICVGACLYLYIFIRFALSCMGAWDYMMFWERNIQEVAFHFVEENELVL